MSSLPGEGIRPVRPGGSMPLLVVLPVEVYNRLNAWAKDDDEKIEELCEWILTDYAPPREIEEDE